MPCLPCVKGSPMARSTRPTLADCGWLAPGQMRDSYPAPVRGQSLSERLDTRLACDTATRGYDRRPRVETFHTDAVRMQMPAERAAIKAGHDPRSLEAQAYDAARTSAAYDALAYDMRRNKRDK